VDIALDPTERRLLGVLIEKQLATPESYPLSVRDLHGGANQKTCREPVTNYAEWEIEGALASLFDKKCATYVDGSRVRKWKHRIDELLGLTPTRMAVLAELLLRGAQQPAELRRNANRLANIPTEADVQAILDDLVSKTPPLVRRLERAPRERDARWTQTLAPDLRGATPETPLRRPKRRRRIPRPRRRDLLTSLRPRPTRRRSSRGSNPSSAKSPR
jgi:uncharacterized protein